MEDVDSKRGLVGTVGSRDGKSVAVPSWVLN
jgi:hypothetical protein